MRDTEMDIPIQFDEDVEEGQVGPLDDYDPAFEYPSGGGNEVSQYPIQPSLSSPSPPPAPATNRTTVFRLLRLRSSILSRSKRIAVLDGHAEVSIGRDVAPTARVRLKEMAVSKFHASIYWDSLRREWGIVDMGSLHGTFLRSVQDPSTSAGAAGSERTPGTRLSEARRSSMPKVLRHLDEITVAGTTFLVHEHLTGRPCADCATDGAEEIPLFALGKHVQPEDEQSRKRKRGNDPSEKDPKKAMSNLKSSLMSRHASSSTSSSNSTYKDRSALRRELHPEPRVPSTPVPIQLDTDRNPAPIFRVPSPPPPLAPPAALPSSNIGHRLLMQQGWNPGTALGENPDGGLVEPLNLFANASRAGLGSSLPLPLSQPSGDWKEDAKRRRWDGVRGQ